MRAQLRSACSGITIAYRHCLRPRVCAATNKFEWLDIKFFIRTNAGNKYCPARVYAETATDMPAFSVDLAEDMPAQEKVA